jgi:hypothetical protein
MTTLKQKAVKYLVAVVIKTFYKFEKFEACVGFFFFKFLIGYNTHIYAMRILIINY